MNNEKSITEILSANKDRTATGSPEQNPARLPFPCSQCDKSFETAHGLTVHGYRTVKSPESTLRKHHMTKQLHGRQRRASKPERPTNMQTPDQPADNQPADKAGEPAKQPMEPTITKVEFGTDPKLQQAKADKERLDWLEANWDDFTLDESSRYIEGKRPKDWTLRAAIDAAGKPQQTL